MWSRLANAVGFPLLVLAIITFVSAVLLGIGTALAFLFAVTVWEATIVVTVVASGAFWFLSRGDVRDYLFEYPYLEIEPDWSERVPGSELSAQSGRRGRRRKR
jgi:hypothetical protein